MKRYQECNFLIKIWRCRWHLYIPFESIYFYLKGLFITNDDTGEKEKSNFKLIYRLMKSQCSIRKNNVYTTDEVMTRIKERIL